MLDAVRTTALRWNIIFDALHYPHHSENVAQNLISLLIKPNKLLPHDKITDIAVISTWTE